MRRSGLLLESVHGGLYQPDQDQNNGCRGEQPFDNVAMAGIQASAPGVGWENRKHRYDAQIFEQVKQPAPRGRTFKACILLFDGKPLWNSQVMTD